MVDTNTRRVADGVDNAFKKPAAAAGRTGMLRSHGVSPVAWCCMVAGSLCISLLTAGMRK
jgi:hypothetical protein